jgi:hypothetical protein
MIKNNAMQRNDSDSRIELENANGAPRNMSMVQPGTIIENKPVTEEVYRCISYNDVQALKELLVQTDTTTGEAINVIEMRDARRFTVLSYSCYKNLEECFMILYNHALDKNLAGIKNFESKNRILQDWAN